MNKIIYLKLRVNFIYKDNFDHIVCKVLRLSHWRFNEQNVFVSDFK